MSEKRKVETKVVDGRKLCRYEGTSIWQVCDNQEDK